VLAPILIFVALEIMAQAFIACPAKHAPAVAFAFFPTIARLVQIKLSDPVYVAPAVFSDLLVKAGKALPELQIIVALGNGFILTAMLWGAFLACLIDHKLRKAAVYLLVLAGFTFFGVIHSAMPDGNLYLPWQLPSPARLVPFQFALAYFALAAMVWASSFIRTPTEPKENFVKV
jgi:AGZA family xanthine/uracil permease-like MFS transporter